MLQNYLKFFFQGDGRTVKAKKQIAFSFFQKGISVVISLLFVPLILNYLDPERYGIWLTLSTIIGWASFFDLGLSNGLRNRFSEAVANNNLILARKYISTSYGILGLIFSILIILFLLFNPLINWQKLIHTDTISNNELSLIATIVFIFFILRFFFNIIGTILLADQRPAINNSFNLISNIISFLIIYILTFHMQGSLIVLSCILSIVPVVVLIFATFYFFIKDYNMYLPKIQYIDFSKSKELLGLSFSFFFLQIASIVFFSTTNFLIAQTANQSAVAAYNIAFKYLFIINMVQSIILSPVWSAVTEAYCKEDYNWLKKTLKKLNQISLVLVLFVLVILFISPIVYKFWIGNKINIPFPLTALLSIYLIQQLYIAPYSQFINGFGKLRISMIVLTIKLLIFIPLAYVLSHYFSVNGIIIAMIIIQIPSMFLEPIQVNKIINKKSIGLWHK